MELSEARRKTGGDGLTCHACYKRRPKDPNAPWAPPCRAAPCVVSDLMDIDVTVYMAFFGMWRAELNAPIREYLRKAGKVTEEDLDAFMSLEGVYGAREAEKQRLNNN